MSDGTMSAGIAESAAQIATVLDSVNKADALLFVAMFLDEIQSHDAGSPRGRATMTALQRGIFAHLGEYPDQIIDVRVARHERENEQ